MFRQSRCLNTSDSICGLFNWVWDRNDRNDKGNGKSYVRANDRGFWIRCHSCHFFGAISFFLSATPSKSLIISLVGNSYDVSYSDITALL